MFVFIAKPVSLSNDLTETSITSYARIGPQKPMSHIFVTDYCLSRNINLPMLFIYGLNIRRDCRTTCNMRERTNRAA
nr:MAG TPA: hypothetical protein [Caudoviricetes sp.]